MNEHIEILFGECTCLRSPSSMGVDIPMIWNETLDNTVVCLREDIDGITEGRKSTIEWGILTTALWTLGAIVFAVGITTVAIVLHNRRA